MNAALLERPSASMPDDYHYARNLIGGRWLFPAAPYDYEIRNPADSTITATVPLSSRLDVARAINAATEGRRGPWASPDVRGQLLHRLVERLVASGQQLAHLQCIESGLSWADSLRLLDATLHLAETLLSPTSRARSASAGGTSGHILSWGLPFTEVVTSVMPPLAAGGTVIVKPSLRGPLTPLAFGYLATEAGLPPGVVNIVQGSGVDVGAELLTRPDLCSLQVRAGERTLAQAERSHHRTRVPLHTLRAGGNLMVVGPGGNTEVDTIADQVTAAVRVHCSGGPFGLPLLAVHRDCQTAILPAVIERLSSTVAAPLPSDALRQEARQRVATLVNAGAQIVLGGTGLPDDVTHRMGWRMPPTVLTLGAPDSPAARAHYASIPLGPVLGVIAWDRLSELATACATQRARQGTATIWGMSAQIAALPHGLIVPGESALVEPSQIELPAAWTGAAV